MSARKQLRGCWSADSDIDEIRGSGRRSRSRGRGRRSHQESSPKTTGEAFAHDLGGIRYIRGTSLAFHRSRMSAL